MPQQVSPPSFQSLAELFTQELREGHVDSVEEFADRFPDQRELILSEFPAIEIFEATIRFQPPREIGDYILGDEIGRGGMGFVYAGQHRELQNNVAIKIMPKRQFRDVQSIDRFRREARACAALDHPHIVPVYHFGETDTLAYLVMRRVAGRSLTTWKAPSDPHKLSVRLARIGLQAAMALQYSHEKGIIHRDIKPGNLLMEDGHLWLTDFGLAKRLEAGDLTRTGQVVGTLRYLAPEMLQNVCGPTSDIYGLGLTLYELASGQPFGDDETSATTTYMLPHLSEKSSAIPAQLSQIIMKACAFRPEDRYQSAAEMIVVLQRFLDGQKKADRRRTNALQRHRWRRKSWLAAGLSCTALACLAWSRLSQSPPTPPTSVQQTITEVQTTNSSNERPRSPAQILNRMHGIDPGALDAREQRIEAILKSQPKVRYVAETDKFLMLHQGTYPWRIAEVDARTAGIDFIFPIISEVGTLATIRSVEENRVAWELAKKFDTSAIIAGLCLDEKSTNANNWHWQVHGELQEQFWPVVKNTEPTYTNFTSGQPESREADQIYLQIRVSDGKWQPINRHALSAYLVEWDASRFLDEPVVDAE